MLAARDQENLAYSHQTNAANKPLNQGFRGLQPKTPGRAPAKTPFKKLLNDENHPGRFEGPKTGLKSLAKGGDDHGLQDKRRDGKFNSYALVTPVAPRTRAPLGMKTTNAKARASQNPVPQSETKQAEKTLKKPSTIRRSVKSKIRVALSEPAVVDVLSKEDDSDIPEIEYCPPPPIALPDPPIEITYDDTFPYLRGNKLCGGYSDVYDIPRDEHGVSLGERKQEEAHNQMLQKFEDDFREEMAKPWRMEDEDDMVDATIAAGPKKLLDQSSNVDVLRSRSAVAALSSPPQTRLPSAVTKQTASSMQKKKRSLPVLGAKKVPLQPSNPSSMRHNAAVATSKTTIGYSKGRNVSSVLPERAAKGSRGKCGKIDQAKIDPLEFRELYGEPPVGSKMWDRFREYGLFDSESPDGEDEDGLVSRWGIEEVQIDDEEEIFQLPMPDDM